MATVHKAAYVSLNELVRMREMAVQKIRITPPDLSLLKNLLNNRVKILMSVKTIGFKNLNTVLNPPAWKAQM